MRARVALLAPVLLLTAACVFPEQVQTLENSVADLRKDLAVVQKTQADSAQKLDAIEAKLGDGGVVTRQDYADLKVAVDQVSRDVATAQEGVQDANRRMDRLRMNE